MKRQFTDQVVWITGAGSGLGQALAIELARRGARVALSGRRVERLEQVAKQVEAAGGRALVVPCDVTDEEAVQATIAKVVAELGGIDVAIANAGMSVVGSIEKLSLSEWHQQFGVNLFGLVSSVKHSLPELRKTRGRLVLMGSIVSFLAGKRAGAYCASKFAVRAIGLTLSQELHGTGVSCTTICPGFVESEINRVDNSGRYHASRRDLRPKRLMWTADKAARVMVDAIAKRKREFVFTGHGKIGAFLGQHFPGLVSFALGRVGALK